MSNASPTNCSYFTPLLNIARSGIKYFSLYLSAFLFCGGISSELIASEDKEPYRHPGPNEVQIAYSGIKMPMGRILLGRKGTEYFAIKFTHLGPENERGDISGEYECYYQGDSTGNFFNLNVQFEKGIVNSKLRGFWGMPFELGDPDIKCGQIKLGWWGGSGVSFRNSKQEERDYGIELAPTEWTDISQVNIFDPRIRWFRFDKRRWSKIIPIDQLWQANEKSMKDK